MCGKFEKRTAQGRPLASLDDRTGGCWAQEEAVLTEQLRRDGARGRHAFTRPPVIGWRNKAGRADESVATRERHVRVTGPHVQRWPAVRPLVAARGGLAWCGGAVVYRCSCAATHRGGARPSGACCTPPCCVPCGPTGTRRGSRGGARRPIGQRVDLLRLALLQGVRDQESQSGTLKIQGQGPRRVACLCDERAARIGMRSVFIYERRIEY